jgi:hypothetical protein
MKIDEAVVSVLRSSSERSANQLLVALKQSGVKTCAQGLRAHLLNLLKTSVLSRDENCWPFTYSLAAKSGPVLGKPSLAKPTDFPAFLVATRRKGKEFRNGFNSSKEVEKFLKGLTSADEVSVYKKIDCKKEVKVEWTI